MQRKYTFFKIYHYCTILIENKGFNEEVTYNIKYVSKFDYNVWIIKSENVGTYLSIKYNLLIALYSNFVSAFWMINEYFQKFSGVKSVRQIDDIEAHLMFWKNSY